MRQPRHRSSSAAYETKGKSVRCLVTVGAASTAKASSEGWRLRLRPNIQSPTPHPHLPWMSDQPELLPFRAQRREQAPTHVPSALLSSPLRATHPASPSHGRRAPCSLFCAPELD
jgi:hypothetical protein